MSEEPKYFRPPGYDYSRESIKNRPSDAQPPADSPYIPEISEEITDAQAAALEARVFQDLPAPEAPKEGKLEKLRSKVANSKLVKWLGLAEIDEQEEPSSTAEFSEPKAPTGQDGPSWVEKASRILGLDAPAKQYEDALNSPDDEFSFLPTPPSIPISNSVTQETTIKNQEQETSSLNLKEKSSQLFSIPNHFLEGGPDVLEGMEYVGYNKTVEDTSKSALVNTSAPAVVDQKILIDEATKRLRQTISSRGEKLGLVNRGKNETQPSKINYQKSLLNKSRPAPQIRGQVTEREKKAAIESANIIKEQVKRRKIEKYRTERTKMPDKETAVGNDVYAFNAALSEINTSNTSRKIVNILVPTQSRHGATLSGYTGDSSMDNIKKYEVTQTTGWSLRGTTLNNYQQSLIVTEDGNLLATTDSLLYSGGENVIAGYVYMENVQAQLNKLYEKNPSSYLGTSYEPVNPEVARIRDAIRGMQEIADYDSAQKS